MRTLYLMGMAPPIEKVPQLTTEARDTMPRPSGRLGRTLVALDPRHGVFPNHVMTPLMATLYHLRSCAADADNFLQHQLPDILDDESGRRLNVLKMPEGRNLAISAACKDMVDEKLDTSSHLLLVFGYWSISSLVFYTLTGRPTFSETEVDAMSRAFLKGVLDKLGNRNEYAPFGLPKKRTPRPGVYFRLLTCSDTTTANVTEAITATVEQLRESGCDAERVTRLYRSIVPLPHDEAYKNKPTGKFQNCFMLGSDPEHHAQIPAPPQVFWRHIGSTIARRLLMGDDPLR